LRDHLRDDPFLAVPLIHIWPVIGDLEQRVADLESR
jgi:hypothetical protein